MENNKNNERLNILTQEFLEAPQDSLQDIEIAKQIAEQLAEVIRHNDNLYYVLAEPKITDIEYDYLFDYLKRIETVFPSLVSEDWPTQKVAKGLSDSFETVVHLVPMLSLNKAYSDEDLREWDISVKKVLEEEQVEYVLEPKLDGASMALVYENGILTRAATRGNGTAGDDITNNSKAILSVPLSADFGKYGIKKAEVRGEVVISKANFEILNEERTAKDEKLLSNPRNSAAGALRQKKPAKVAERKVEALIFQLGFANDENENNVLFDVKTHSETINILHELGFKTPFLSEIAATKNETYQNIEEVIIACNKWREQRESYAYEIDGVVIKVNNYKLQDLAGNTSHHPRWAVALKFDAKQATTILENVEFQVGRTGAITPVAKLKTVNLAGANISNASLHNEDFIQEKDIKIGDTVVIERAGDVIPYIVQVLPEKRTGNEQEVSFPTHCPSCNEETEKSEGESVWRCINSSCPAQVEERIIHFVSKGAMDIRGLGRDIVKRFFKDELLKQIPDIYKLDYQKISQLEGWGKRSVENLEQSIEASKNQELYRLIVGLGIREVGSTTAKLLAQQVEKLADLSIWTTEQLMELPDIGPKVADNVVHFFKHQPNVKLIDELRKVGVNTKRKDSEKAKEGGLFQGLTFLFTGTLQELKRNEAKKIVEDNGGKVVSAVSKKLNYLVVGEQAGSKLKKAQQIETIKIVTEAEFLEMVK